MAKLSDKQEDEKNPVGRPSSYKPEYCQELIDYIENWEPFYETPVDKQDREGNVTTSMVKCPNPPPSLYKFSKLIGVSRDTLYEWGRVHKEFSYSIKVSRDAMEEALVDNSILGIYNSSSAIFALKNRCHWTDKQENTNTHEFPTGIDITFEKPGDNANKS